MREAELRQAARVLGLEEVVFLDYIDGELDRAEPAEVISALALYIRQIKPHVVVTFDPHGYYGHPDHIAIAQHTTAAIVAAADSSYAADLTYGAHRVAKLYYVAPTQEMVKTYQRAFGALMMQIDGVERHATSWADWAITTRIDTTRHWPRVWQAVSCHRTQLPNYQALQMLPATDHRRLWGTQTFYRALSLINGGRSAEVDLFAGLR